MQQLLYRANKGTPLTNLEWDADLRALRSAVNALESAFVPLPAVLPISGGGTNSSTALNNNRVMVSSGGAIVEASAITSSRALVSNGSGIPIASTVTTTQLQTLSDISTSVTVQTQLNDKFDTPAGTTSQYVRGDGSLATFPSGLAPSGAAGGDLSGTYPNPVIGANKVTLAKFQQVATGTLLGRNTGGTGNIEVLTMLPFTISVNNGGTGITSYTVGDIIYASGATTLSKLPDVATGNALISGGVATAPSWGKIGLTTHVSGVLPAANGGTGVANSSTITIGGNFTMSGGFTFTGTLTGNTGVTFPTSGTLATTGIISGTNNYVTKFTSSSSIGDSSIFDDGTSVGVGTATPGVYVGYRVLSVNGTSGGMFESQVNGTVGMTLWSFSGGSLLVERRNQPLVLGTNNLTRVTISNGGTVTIADLAGTGTQMVTADINGLLSKTTIPTSSQWVTGASGIYTNNKIAVGTGLTDANASYFLYAGGDSFLGGNVSMNGTWAYIDSNKSVTHSANFAGTVGYQMINSNATYQTLHLVQAGSTQYALNVFGQTYVQSGTYDIAATAYISTPSTNWTIGASQTFRMWANNINSLYVDEEYVSIGMINNTPTNANWYCFFDNANYNFVEQSTATATQTAYYLGNNKTTGYAEQLIYGNTATNYFSTFAYGNAMSTSGLQIPNTVLHRYGGVTNIDLAGSAAYSWWLAGTTKVMSVPLTAGTANYFLQTNGSGVTTWAQAFTGTITTGTIPQATGSGVLGNSIITQAGGAITITGALGIGQAPGELLDVRGNGDIMMRSVSNNGNKAILGLVSAGNFGWYVEGGAATMAFKQDSSDMLTMTPTTAVFSGTIQTVAPSGHSASAWALGNRDTGVVVTGVEPGVAVWVEIGGVVAPLAVAQI